MSVTNTTCMCGGNEDLDARVVACIVANCNGPDAISKSNGTRTKGDERGGGREGGR